MSLTSIASSSENGGVSGLSYLNRINLFLYGATHLKEQMGIFDGKRQIQTRNLKDRQQAVMNNKSSLQMLKDIVKLSPQNILNAYDLINSGIAQDLSVNNLNRLISMVQTTANGFDHSKFYNMVNSVSLTTQAGIRSIQKPDSFKRRKKNQRNEKNDDIVESKDDVDLFIYWAKTNKHHFI